MVYEASREEDRLAVLEGKVENLSLNLERIESRLALLEAHGAPIRTAVPAAASPPPEELDEALPSASDLTRILGLVGRTLIVFGGAYLLRAVTAAGYLPEVAGVLLAFLYALAWLAMAYRTSARGLTASAEFHGATAVLIGFPLLWETTARFHYLGPISASAALAFLLAVVVVVSWRRGLQGLAWMVGLAAPVTAMLLLGNTHQPVPFGFDLVLLGALGLLLYHDRGWSLAGWWMALLGPFGGFMVAFGAVAQKKGGEPAALWIGLLLCLTYLAVLVHRSLVRHREAGSFDIVQSVLAVLVGFGGAAVIGQRLGGGALVLAGTAGLLLAVAAYVAAFQIVPRQQRRNLLLFSTLALGFALTGSGMLLSASARAIVWSGLAALAAWQAVRRSRVTLSLHGAAYAAAAAAASGLLTASAYAFVAPPETAWPHPAPEAWLALAAAALVCALPVPRPAPFWKPYERLTRMLQISVFLWGAAGVVLHLLYPAFGGGTREGLDPGMIATVRTAVLAAVAFLLGWVARWERFREAAWLVYPTLILAALKLLVEDFPHGRPATLFVALALCGLAFIFAPRLARRAQGEWVRRAGEA